MPRIRDNTLAPRTSPTWTHIADMDKISVSHEGGKLASEGDKLASFAGVAAIQTCSFFSIRHDRRPERFAESHIPWLRSPRQWDALHAALMWRSEQKGRHARSDDAQRQGQRVGNLQ
jgi:hypothetical protein